MNSRQLTISSIFALMLAIGAIWLLQPAKPLQWTMANVNTDVLSGDAHLLRLPNGENWLIDAGYKDFAYGRLLPGIVHHNINRLHGVIITHAHRNHYGGLIALLDSGIQVDKVFFNKPNMEQCDLEKAGGRCVYDHVLSVFTLLKNNGIPIEPIKSDTLFFEDTNLTLKLHTLYQFPARGAPFGDGTINDTSPVMKLEYGDSSVLFAGDIGIKPGAYLAEHGQDLKADFLVVPHHGVHATTPNSFFDRVSPYVAMVSGPYATFNGERGKQVRDYFYKHQIPLRVAGIEGALTINLHQRGFSKTIITPAPEFSSN